MNFLFGTNGKFIILGVPILKHIRVGHVNATKLRGQLNNVQRTAIPKLGLHQNETSLFRHLCYTSQTLLLQALKKGISDTLSGWIFGTQPFVQFLISPMFGKLVSKSCKDLSKLSFERKKCIKTAPNIRQTYNYNVFANVDRRSQNVKR